MKTLNLIRAAVVCLFFFSFVVTRGADSEPAPPRHYRLFDSALVMAGSNTPTVKEDRALQLALEKTRAASRIETDELENFVEKFPESAWISSIRLQLANHYRETGSYSRSLAHWEAVWKVCGTATNGTEKDLADATLVKWTRLLASLGRVAQLETVFKESENRVLDAGPLQQTFLKTKEAFHIMKGRPDIAYRCGTLALNAVARVLMTNQPPRVFLDLPSPPTGFCLKDLGELAAEAKVPLVPARRTNSAEVIVPSVVHWKQNHYAAITKQRGERYYVTDPTFERPLWLTADEINAEASGYFMIPASNVTARFLAVTPDEASRVFGKGWPNGMQDSKDAPCPPDMDCPCRVGAPGGGGSGGGSCRRGICQSPPIWRHGGGGLGTSEFAPERDWTAGMAQWSISEPFINLWVQDEPLVYRASRGPAVRFLLSYKQRDEVVRNTNVFSFGKLWNASFFSYLLHQSPGTPTITNVTAYLPGGGVTVYNEYMKKEPVLNTRLFRIDAGQNTGFKILYPSGAEDEYNLVVPGVNNYVYLTARRDPLGNTVQFIYSTNGPAPIVRLLYIVDAEGLTNTVSYVTSHPYSTNLIASITDPYGKSASFAYSSIGHLTNITDTLGISSGFAYSLAGNSAGWMTNLATPYGNTSFELTNIFPAFPTPRVRVATITDPDGAKERYFYSDDGAPFMPTQPEDFPLTNSMPAAARDELSESWTPNYNSAYWNRYQFLSVSSAGQTNVTSLSSNDFRIARVRHWMTDEEETTGAIAYERPAAPAVDAALPRRIWYGYPTIITPHPDDIDPLDLAKPSVVAIRLPNNETRFSWKEFNSAGAVTNEVQSYTDMNGNAAYRSRRFEYQPGDDADGVQLQYAYDFSGHLTASNIYIGVGGNGMAVGEHYNAMGEKTTYAYQYGRIWHTRTPGGLTISNVFDSAGIVTQSIAIEIGATNAFGYTKGLLTTNTDPRGLKVIYKYDSLDRLVSTTFPDGTYTSNRYTLLDVTGTRDRLGNWTSFGYDSMRRLIGVTNALGHATTYGYCPCGSVSTITNALGEVAQTFYDLAGRVVSTHFPDGSWTTNLYDTFGQLSAVLNSSGNRITNAYTLQGTVYAISNAFGELSYTVSDIDDHILKQWDSVGALTTNVYDALGRLVLRVQDSSQGKASYVYDLRGLTAVTNYGSGTVYSNDAAGRRIYELTPNGNWMGFDYSAAGDLVFMHTETDEDTTWAYDEYGHVTNKMDPYGLVVTYRYDANGRLTNRWTPAKAHTFYAYDAIGNLTNVNYSASADLQFKYDALNRITNMVDGVGTTSYAFDVGGNLIMEDGPWSGDTVTASYSNGSRSTLAVAGSGGVSAQSFGYTYDAMGRLSIVSSPAGAFTNTYWLDKPTRLPQRITFPGGSYVTNWYDARGWMVGTALKNGAGTALDSYSYARLSGGAPEIARMTRDVDGSTVDYGYDLERELTSARGKEAGGADRLHEQFGYVYDEGGNLLARTNGALYQTFEVDRANNQLIYGNTSGDLTVAGMVQGSPTNVTVNSAAAELYADKTFARRTNWTGGAINTFTAEARDAVGRIATETVSTYLNAAPSFAYDGNGNLLTDGRRHFTWDDENQLIAVVVTNTTKSEFSYDGKMRCRIRKEFLWQNAAWHQTEEVRYIYDANLVLQERHYDPQPSTTFAQRIVTYSRGLDLSGSWQGAGGIGGLLARAESTGGNTQAAFYHADIVGNVTALVDTNQQIVARYLYEPFGNLLAMNGPLAQANLYRFSSKEAHEQSSLIYYLYRLYEPQLQRWLNRDPIEESGGFNLYAFVRNSPMKSLDAWGLDLWVCTNPAFEPLPGSRHAYMWDDSLQEPCAMQASSGSKRDKTRSKDDKGPDPGETSPWIEPGQKIICTRINTTKEQAEKAFNCCRDTANDLPWVPGWTDCHYPVTNCLEKNGIPDPPHPRWDHQFDDPPLPHKPPKWGKL